MARKNLEPVAVEPLDPRAVGERIRAARVRQGWTQKELGAAVQRRKCTISNWEAGVFIPQVRTLHALAANLRCSVGWLLYGRRRWPREEKQPGGPVSASLTGSGHADPPGA